MLELKRKKGKTAMETFYTNLFLGEQVIILSKGMTK